MTDIHLVPVKAKDLDAVYALLARRNEASSNGVGASADTAESVEVPKNGTWSRSDLVDLHGRCFDRNRAILDRIATASLNGSDTNYGELLEAARPLGKDPSTYDFNNLRADLAWIAKYAKKVKGGVNGWPMTVRELDESHAKGDRYIYRMPRQIAEWWLDISGGG